jgi:hypothetical protein
MRTDLVGMPVVTDHGIKVIRAVWMDKDWKFMVMLENRDGRLEHASWNDFRLLCPQVMSLPAGRSLRDRFPEIFGHRSAAEIVEIWQQSLEYRDEPNLEVRLSRAVGAYERRCQES